MLHDGEYTYTSPALSTLAKRLEATDLRDKVYGILGLLPPPIQDKIEVDVGKSIVALYANFTRSLLEYDNSLELLERAGISNSSIADLPSWRIDVSQDEETLGITHPFAHFRAGRSKTLFPCIEYFDADSSRLLTILGWKVDCITEVVQDMPHWNLDNWDMETSGAATQLEEACLHISRTIFNTPDDIPDEHWRTITGDCRRDEK
jgi:hypothetical protein